MTWIWFGLDGTGIGASHVRVAQLMGRHRTSISLRARANCGGPVLVPRQHARRISRGRHPVAHVYVAARLTQLTRAVSELSDDATGESLYRRAVTTFEGRKSDAIFNYSPPRA